MRSYENEMYKIYDDFEGFGEEISYKELRKIWDDNHEDDPCLNYFDSFEEWFKETLDNGWIAIA